MPEKPTVSVRLTEGGVEVISDNRPTPTSLLPQILSLRTRLNSLGLPDNEIEEKQKQLDALTKQFDSLLWKAQRQATNAVLQKKGIKHSGESSLPY